MNMPIWKSDLLEIFYRDGRFIAEFYNSTGERLCIGFGSLGQVANISDDALKKIVRAIESKVYEHINFGAEYSWSNLHLIGNMEFNLQSILSLCKIADKALKENQ